MLTSFKGKILQWWQLLRSGVLKYLELMSFHEKKFLCSIWLLAAYTHAHYKGISGGKIFERKFDDAVLKIGSRNTDFYRMTYTYILTTYYID